MTRARQALIVSAAEARGLPGSWYARMRSALVAVRGHDDQPDVALVYGDALAGPRAAQTSGTSTQPQEEESQEESAWVDALATVLPTGRRRAIVASPGQRYGSAFHLLMQHAPGAHTDAPRLARRLGLALAQVAPMWAQAQRLMTDPELVRFFDPRHFERSLDEWPLLTAAGELRRVDRMVEFRDEVWVLDYKTGALAAVAGTTLESEYRAQVEGYRAALGRVFTTKRVCALILFSDGSRIVIE